ncbi:hypothetical protein BH11MYX3_BH11MYX3_29960 [soil metagenome]
MKLGLWVLLVAVGACCGPQQRRGVDEATTLATIQRALPLIQHSQEVWIGERECMSCHHQGLGMLALVVAREHGATIDEPRFTAQVTAMQDELDMNAEELVATNAFFNGQFGGSYRSIALATAGAPRGRWSDLMAHFVAGKQAPDGRWPSELHRPPLEDRAISATAWSIRALQMFAPPNRAAEMKRRVARGVEWLAHQAPKETEDAATQLLGLRWGGSPRAVRAPLATALLRTQRDDGGWAQLPTRKSDSYATGQALVALHIAGELPTTDDAYQRGVAFLVRTQLADGSWHVRTRRKTNGLPYFETGYPHGIDQFISISGASWAVMALALSHRPRTSSALLDERSHDIAAPREFDLSDVAVAGTVEELRAALIAPLDVTGRDARLLAFGAVHDPARLQLVLDRGVPVSTRSIDGVSLLAAAANYGGANASVSLLLERGASPRSDVDGEGRTPLMAAASRGEVASVRALLDAGAPLGEAFGTAAVSEHADVMGLLLERGATANGPDYEQRPTLVWAVIDRNLALVEYLLAHGADINGRDPEGQTPLHWAAIVDPGTPAIIDRLVRGGADPLATTNAGKTALDLAIEHENPLAVRALRAAQP